MIDRARWSGFVTELKEVAEKIELKYGEKEIDNHVENNKTPIILFTEKYDETNIPATLKNEVESLGGQISNLYYANGLDGIKNNVYLYEPTIKVVFKIEGINIWNTTIHSVDKGNKINPSNQSDDDEEEPEIVHMDPDYKYGYYEPNLDGFDPKNTYIIYYSSDYSETKEVVLEKYMADGRPRTIKEGVKTFTFHEYKSTKDAANTSTWGNIKTVANGLEAWWVWAPRYSYNVNTKNKTTGFEIKFTTVENKVIQIDEDNKVELKELSDFSGYIQHPGFDKKESDDSITKLTGIWFSKYEPTLTTSPAESKNKTFCYAPNLEGYDINNTYIVTYDKTGAQVKNQYLLKNILKTGYTATNAGALIKGNVDMSKIPNDEVWYDYGNKIWGNVKTVANGLEAWWVWAPRYAYVLEGNSSGFSIVFVDTDDKPFDGAQNDYLKFYKTHPGFNKTESDGSVTKLKGIWFSKYEPSKNTGKVEDTVKTKCYAPNMEGYDVYQTFIVTYNKAYTNSEGTYVPYAQEQKNQYRLADVLTSDSVIENGILKSGDVDITKIPNDEVWYDYGSQVWGNIKTVANGLEAWWVWAPRYSYVLEGNSSGFSILFVDTDDKPFDEDIKDTLGIYKIHPGFNKTESDGSVTKLKGIWFSKYEPTNVSDVDKSSGSTVIIPGNKVQTNDGSTYTFTNSPTDGHTHVPNGAGTKLVHVTNRTDWCTAYNGTTPCSNNGHYIYCSLCGVRLRHYWCDAHYGPSTKVIINDD